MDSEEIPKRNQTIVFFSNTSEDVWPFIKRIGDKAAREWEVEENALLSDRDLFALSEYERIVFVTPRQVSPEYLNYFQSIFGKKDIQVIVPKEHTGKLCQDVKEEYKTWKILLDLGKQEPLTLMSYSSSKWFLSLVDDLREDGAAVHTPQAPDQNSAWTVNFFGSKTGIRQLVQQVQVDEPEARMPTGFVVSGLQNGADIATARHMLNHGVVIKTQKGHAGVGVLIFRPNDLPKDFTLAREKILEILKKDHYWEDFPMVVEDFIDTDPTISNGFPNIEMRVDDDGKVQFLYPCGLRVTRQGNFQGVEIHSDIASPEIIDKMVRVGMALGKEYARYGYRGYFDVDFAMGKDGHIYVNESNVRRTGGTHVYHAAKALFGPDFLKKTYTLSNNNFVLPPGSPRRFSQLIERLQPVLYSPNTKEGVLLCGENLLAQNKMAYIIFGHNNERADAIEEQMMALLNAD